MSRAYDYYIAQQEEPQLAQGIRGGSPRKLSEREIRAVHYQEMISREGWEEREAEYQAWLKNKPMDA
jgi:hypothetical protein